MAVIETKFGIGDVVWNANTTTETFSHPCPDCLGSRKWETRSPAGGVFETPCIRCSANYQSNHRLNLKYSQWTPYVRRLTVGLVRANAGGDRGHEYMCLETGIGSGSLYYEDRLFATEAQALACAKATADLANADASGWVAKQYDETAQLCDYQLKDAEIAAATSQSRQALYRIQYLLEDLDSADTLDAVKERIASWREEAR